MNAVKHLYIAGGILTSPYSMVKIGSKIDNNRNSELHHYVYGFMTGAIFWPLTILLENTGKLEPLIDYVVKNRD